ncbi:hypothetical protein AAUPMC_10632, partial [Pasteurella multocida subsp. multocida str. Anand1_cattle]
LIDGRIRNKEGILWTSYKDMIVVGGGMVGAACALGLGNKDIKSSLSNTPHSHSFNLIRLTIFAFLRSVLLPLIS